MDNIIKQLQAFISPQLLSGLAGAVGESPEGVSKAMDGIFPLLLSGIMKKSADPGSAGAMNQIMESFKNSSPLDALIQDPAKLLSAAADDSDLGKTAGALIANVFGDKTASIVDFLANSAGIKPASASRLLSVAAPLVMGFLGDKVRSGGLSLPGLLSYLIAQKNNIVAAAPSGLGGLLGLASLEQLGAKLPEVLPAAKEKSSMKKPLIVLIILLAAFLLWKSCGKEDVPPPPPAAEVKKEVVETASDAAKATTEAVSTVASDAATAVADAASGTAEAAKNLWASLGNLLKTVLPNGIELNLPEFGVEKKLLGFIEDAGKAVDTSIWFSFDRLLFETGSSTLKPDSQEQLKNIAEIMNAYPAVEIKLGGYTDTTGDPQSNLKLSQDRADSVKQQLVGLGVAENRIVAEGYGQEHPVATNDTEEGRAKNRRIDILVTKK